jgi:hypothetical protein
MKLYEITEQYAEVQKLLDQDDSESMAEAVSETMGLIEADFEEKAQNIVALAFNVESDISGIDEQIKRLQDRKKAIQNKAESLREYLRYNMDRSGIDKISCPLFTITLSKASKQVEVTDEQALPDDFVRVKTTVSPDKVSIAKALKEGADVPGAVLVDGKRRLTIK